MQVCVPEGWSDGQVVSFAESKYPCGTDHGWAIRGQGHRSLNGDNERVKCSGREGFVHIMLDA